ncbi:hypothetical protein L9F63_002546 [Diploptera punctata]|uniref:Uncharacterized protein n=1 Tax=Diploptera punctata TaxID=6984 RepID=A0AAD8ECV8_DIPPU|nr:hypothetical protein L9F63_002546 [Diploptera punctata]
MNCYFVVKEDELPDSPRPEGGLPLLPIDAIGTSEPWSPQRKKSKMIQNVVRKITSTCWRWFPKFSHRGHGESRLLVKKHRLRIISCNTMTLVFIVIFLMLIGHGDAICPAKCSCDDDTLRASCEETGLEVVPIQLNPDIRTINLRDNRIADVHYTLTFYSNLRALDVSRNRISSLGSNDFMLQEKLVSLNASGNQITNLSKFTFSGLKSLRNLDLSGNQIETLEDLSDNQLLDVPTGALRRLPSLRTLNLGDNLIETISDDAIPNLRDLRSLSLEWNVISYIHNAAFDGLLSLEFLNISYNNLTDVPKQQLSKLTSLEELDLSGNQFIAIGPIAFQSLFELRRLRLSSLPRLEKVDVRAFVDNIKLQSVFMERNIELNNIPTRLFHGNPLLVDISVRGNNFILLDASHFPLDQMDSLYLAGNPLHCNCSMLWLWMLARKQYDADLINVTHLPPTTDASPTAVTKAPNRILQLDIDEIRCEGPETVRHLLLVDVPEEEVRCDISWLAVIIVTIVVFTLFAVTCGFLLFLGSDRWCKKPELADTLPSHLHHPHQNGGVLMLVQKKDKMDGMDDFMLKSKDPMVNDVQYHTPHSLATWDSINKENVVADNRGLGITGFDKPPNL